MKVMILFGTRPEVIKLMPVIKEFEKHRGRVKLVLVSTGQHRESVKQMITFFNLRPHYDLDIMRKRQTLAHITSAVISQLDPILRREYPDVLVVQGDTSSSAAGALAASYRAIRVAHVEAGLRTTDRFLPFPEEINRRVTGTSADWHFAPTERAARNLIREGKDLDMIYVTGNTVVDALKSILNRTDLKPPSIPVRTKKELLVTLHRRENFGIAVEHVCYALKEIVEDHPDVSILFPVHWNPHVQQPIKKSLSEHPRIQLLKPFPYIEFLQLLQRCHFVMTDSGGIQEEAPSLGKPVLVLRDVTERPEAIEAGVARLVGTDRYQIISAADELLTSRMAFKSMSCRVSPFGDGRASERIVRILLHEIAGYPFPNDRFPVFDPTSERAVFQ